MVKSKTSSVVCTEIKQVQPLPVNPCDGTLYLYFPPTYNIADVLGVQVEDRHGNQNIINVDANPDTDYNISTIDLSLFPDGVLSDAGVYLLRLLDTNYCFIPMLPKDCSEEVSVWAEYETLAFSFTTPLDVNEWVVVL